MIEIRNAAEGPPVTVCGIMYAPPGTGKTIAAAMLAPGKKKLLVDIDESSKVLRSPQVQAAVPGLKEELENVDVYGVGLDMGRWVELTEWLEDGHAKDYDLIVVDNLTELEHQMLTEYGRRGKNDGAPELLHYNRTQFKVVDYVRRYRALKVNVMFTAWQDIKEVVQPSGEKYSQVCPRLSGKSMDTVCGLCNIVARLEIGTKTDPHVRWFRLTSTRSVYAKDQMQGRKFTKTIGELIA